MWTILSGATNPRDYAYYDRPDSLFEPIRAARNGDDTTQWPIRVNGHEVLVDVFITVYGEDLETIRRTAAAAKAMHGRHRTWVLDDGRSDEVKHLAGELGCRYVRRLSSATARRRETSTTRCPSPRATTSRSSTRTSCPSRTSSSRRCRSSSTRTSPSSRRRRCTATSTPSSRAAPATCRPCSTGSSNRAGTASTPRSASEPTWSSAAGRSTTSAACTPTASPRTCGPRSCSTSAAGAASTSPTSSPSATRPRPSRRTASSSCAGPPAGSRSCLTHNPLSPRRAGSRPTSASMYFVTATLLPHRHHPLLLLLVPPLEIYFDLRPMNLDLGLGTWLLYYAGFYVMQIVLAWFTLGSFRWESPAPWRPCRSRSTRRRCST